MPDVYNRNSVTKKGYNLLAESIATKKPITFTKVVVGDGDDTGLDINTMTGVVSPKMELPIGNGEKGRDGEYVIQAVLSNKTLEHSFFPKEVGLFAKCGDGEEVLYSYSNGGNNVGLMPDKNTPINAEIYNIRTKIGNATNITFIASDDTYITKGELTKHNADANAHDNRFNAIIQQVNNMITSVDNSDSLAKAPTLQLVKTLLSNLNIKNATDVVNALESEKATGLGIRYDFSNVTAWYICLGKLFGNLIIQGGKFAPEIASITFPIRFNEVLAVLPMMLDEPTPWHEMMIRPKAITASTFKMVSGSNNTNYPKSRNNGCWIAIGN
nr:MAG TPA: tail collar fiber protein [Caudoviricetes sp.]